MSAGVAQYLREAKARIADPSKWCVGVVYDGDCKECAVTAVYKVADNTERVPSETAERAVEALNHAAIQMHPSCGVGDLQPAAELNDTHGHAAVMRMYDLAIENEEGLS